MESEQPAQPAPARNINIAVPVDEEAGRFADFARVWRTDQTFVLDFAAMTQPPQAETDDDGGRSVSISGRVVSRVRIPASQAWELMKALETQLSAWEKERGIRS